MMQKPIQEYIDISIVKDKRLFELWNSVVPILKMKYIATTKEVSLAIAEKYRFDFEGLLKNEFRIHPEFIYPTILVNDLKCSNDYSGEVKKIYLLDDRILSQYYTTFLRTLKKDTK